MTWAAAALLVVGFLFLAQRMGLLARAEEIFQVTRGALATLRDRELSELEKEKRVQAAARRLLGQFLSITMVSAIALAIPLAIVAAMAGFGLVDLEAALDRTISWEILIGATMLGFAWFALTRSRRG